MLIYSLSYELYYVDREGQFSSKVIPPTQGYATIDDFGNISFLCTLISLNLMIQLTLMCTQIKKYYILMMSLRKLINLQNIFWCCASGIMSIKRRR